MTATHKRGRCVDCGAPVEVRCYDNGQVSFQCNGKISDAHCGLNVKPQGFAWSRRYLATYLEPEKAPQPAPAKEPSNDNDDDGSFVGLFRG